MEEGCGATRPDDGRRGKGGTSRQDGPTGGWDAGLRLGRHLLGVRQRRTKINCSGGADCGREQERMEGKADSEEGGSRGGERGCWSSSEREYRITERWNFKVSRSIQADEDAGEALASMQWNLIPVYGLLTAEGGELPPSPGNL